VRGADLVRRDRVCVACVSPPTLSYLANCAKQVNDTEGVERERISNSWEFDGVCGTLVDCMSPATLGAAPRV
jgi:hypothetical protein